MSEFKDEQGRWTLGWTKREEGFFPQYESKLDADRVRRFAGDVAHHYATTELREAEEWTVPLDWPTYSALMHLAQKQLPDA